MSAEQQRSKVPSTSATPQHSKRRTSQTLRRLLAMLAPHRMRFVVATLALMGGASIGLLYPQAARFAVDVVSSGSTEELNRIALLLLGAFLIQGMLVYVRHYLMSWLGERVVSRLRTQVFSQLLKQPITFFHERLTGELIGRLSSDVTVVEGIIGSQLSIGLRHFLQLIGGSIMLAFTSPRLALYMLLAIPPLTLGSVFFGKKVRVMSKEVQDRLADASAHADETVSAIATVQAFVREKTETQRYSAAVEASFEQALSLARWRGLFMSTVSFLGTASIAGIIWIGGRAVLAGNMTSGELTAFLLYTVMVAVSLGSIAGLWGTLQRAAGATERIFAIIDEEPSLKDAADAKALPEGRGAVEFVDVSFRYPSRPDQSVLKRVSLNVEPGTTVALVGPSGAGKTTLTALVPRFFDVDDGQVRFDGQDVRTLRKDDLRSAIAVVAQDPVLLSGTIAENIAYGREGASDDDIAQAAKTANAHAFISQFEQGYQTAVGERGVKLSGGQRQRIAIARAVLRDPRVLILDEATSNLDSESEHLVQQALAKLMVGRTTLVVAHRLSTVVDADHIVVMKEGEVVESGTHDVLMAQSGVYQKLVERQMVTNT